MWLSAGEMVGRARGHEAYPAESFLRATQITHNTSSVTVTTIAALLASAFAQLRPWRWRCEAQQTVPNEETEKRREMAPRDTGKKHLIGHEL